MTTSKESAEFITHKVGSKEFKYKKMFASIKEADGTVVFESSDVEVPENWSQTASDILAQKYFRKTGVPATTVKIQEDKVYPEFYRSEPVEGTTFGFESSAHQVFVRLAGCWTYWGIKGGYFTTKKEATEFYEQCYFALYYQIASPNSPQWFNTGLNWAYGIAREVNGADLFHMENGKVTRSTLTYIHPQVHACYIQSIDDKLLGGGGIMDLFTREAGVFKYGSGSGSNYSAVRGKGENLVGGGYSSGLMSFLRVGDRSAGAIKSGGTTRRAARMVVVDVDHPEIEEYVSWKTNEENKVAALITGSKLNKRLVTAIVESQDSDTHDKAVAEAWEYGVPGGLIQRAIHANTYGYTLNLAELNNDWQGEAYETVSGQNANNSVSIPDSFMEAVEKDANWDLTARTNGAVMKTIKAKKLWDDIVTAAWSSADPGVHFNDTMNDWNTVANDERIRATNPCSEYIFLDDTACNLASLNLVALMNESKWNVEVFAENLELYSRLFTTVLDISIEMAQFVSEPLARKTFEYRTLGLGYANLGSLIMRLGMAYGDSDSCHFTSAITSIMTGAAYSQSADIAKKLSPFPGYSRNASPFKKVIHKHKDANSFIKTINGYQPLVLKATKLWFDNAKRSSFRNAQVTVIAPTGTIGLVMDCFTSDTLVAVADGRNAVSFKVLAEEGKDVDVYASKNGKTVVRKMRNIRKIKSTTRIIRVRLDDGTSVRCTPEHKFMLRNGEYKRAIDLKRGDSLMRFDSVVTDETGNLRRKIWMGPEAGGNRNKGNYWKLQYKLSGKRLYPKYGNKSGKIIHHKDENSLNDLYDNLQLCKNMSEHLKVHWALKTPEERSAIVKERLSILTPEQLSERSKKSHAAQTPAQRRKRAAKAVAARSSEDRSEWTKRAWETRRKNAKLANKKVYNHKVVSIEEAGFKDVYCGEVDEVKNFSIVTTKKSNRMTGDLSGVVVHNCDTTGIEPDFSLIKMKKLAGGGYMKLVNSAVPQALENLGYNDEDRSEIIQYLFGHGSFSSDTSVKNMIMRTDLMNAGVSDEIMTEVEDRINTFFDLHGIFKYLTERSSIDLNFMLQNQEVFDNTHKYIFGHGTIEGCSIINKADLPVFACAVAPAGGSLVISPMGHLNIVAAAQPFISGGASKTINMPESATVKDISDVYFAAFHSGIKCVSVYRDGSKLSQPLMASVVGKIKKTLEETKAPKEEMPTDEAITTIVKTIIQPHSRNKLPPKRRGYTQKAGVGGQAIYVRTGEYTDGRLGEVFLDMYKEGASFRSLMNSFAIAVSLGLQYGVPLEEFVEAFVFTKFEPAGMVTGHENVKNATSIIDFIFRDLAINYLGRNDLAHIPPKDNNSSPVNEVVDRLFDHSGDNSDHLILRKEETEVVMTKTTSTFGFSGDACPSCNNFTLVRSGTCMTCSSCGSTTGCS